VGLIAALAALVASPAWSATAQAANLDATSILRRMKSALEPKNPVLEGFRIVVEGPADGEATWEGVLARKRVDGESSVVGTLLEPPSVGGYAFLMREREGAPVDEWFYSPPLGRIRRLEYSTRYQPFLGTELTLQDLGLFDVSDRRVSVLGTKQLDGREVYEIQEVPHDRSVYSRIVTLVDAGTMLPVRRQYYDPGGVLWREAEYAAPIQVDGVATILTLHVRDVQVDSRTRLEFFDVVRGADLPDDLFEPMGLDNLARLAALHEKKG